MCVVQNPFRVTQTQPSLPNIEITVSNDSVGVKDNGSGLPERVITESQDYMIRVSDKNHYISPSRGQLGNALKCLYAVPFVLDGNHGRVDIATGGKTHSIDVSIDRISQNPVIKHTVQDSFVKNGTFVKMNLKDLASSKSNLPNGLGIEKIVPDEGTLTKAYVKAYRRVELQKIIDKIIGKIQRKKVDTPKNLEEAVRKKLKDFSFQPWDAAVINLAETAASQNKIERRPS